MFNFESLNMLWPAIGYQSRKLWPFKFAWSIRVQFQDSLYILGLNRTFDSKVMVVLICEEILRSISRVSICYGPQSDVRVKTYHNLNLPKASLLNFMRRGICWVSIKHQCQRLQQFEYAPSFVSNLECLDIRVKSYGHLKFTRAFIFHHERLDILWALSQPTLRREGDA